MGHVNVQIILKNANDVANVRCGIITEPEIRHTTVQAMVDTGSTFPVINKELFGKLGLTVVGERPVSFANNGKAICKITDPVEIHWENRSFTMPTLLVEDAPEILLGVLPLEGMDLIVDPVNQKLVGAHGDQPLAFVYCLRQIPYLDNQG